MNEKINIGPAVAESKLEYNFNNNIIDMNACIDIMYGDDGLMKHLFTCLPRIFIHFLKMSGVHFTWITGSANHKL